MVGLVLLLVSVFSIMPVYANPLPIYDFKITLNPDKDVYSAGEGISYKIWADYHTYVGDDLDHCVSAVITLDPSIENIGQNMPYYCGVYGNKVICEPPYPDMWFWFLGEDYHNWLPVAFEDTQGPDLFTISGTIKEDTPECTLIKSSAVLACYTEEGESIADDAQSVVSIRGDECPSYNTPEFPSMFLPLSLIIGLLGTILFIQRTRNS